LENNKSSWNGCRYQSNGESRTTRKVFNINVELNYLNEQYSNNNIPKESYIDSEGKSLLRVGKIVPKSANLPTFYLRWDEKGNHLNIDMEPNQDGWEQEKKGYKGHRINKMIDRSGNVFHVIIQIPSIDVVFDAIISFNLQREEVLGASIGLDSSCIPNNDNDAII
jgi:hypothetical protein